MFQGKSGDAYCICWPQSNHGMMEWIIHYGFLKQFMFFDSFFVWLQ